MDRRSLALAAITLVSGCAQSVWVKDGADAQDFARDSYQCERDVRQSGYYGAGLVGAANAKSFGDRCLVANGWHLESTAAYAAPVQSKEDYDRRSAAFATCLNAGFTGNTPEFNACFQSHM